MKWLLLLVFVSLAYAVSYTENTAYVYEFASQVKTTASVDGVVQNQGGMWMSGTMTLTCLTVEGSIYGMEMKLSNIVFRDEDEQVISAGGDIVGDLERSSVFFTQMADGSVLSVYTPSSSSEWANIVKKGLLSLLQVHEGRPAEKTYTRTTADVSGVHLTNYRRLEDGTIEGNYDQSSFEGRLPEDVNFRGTTLHRLGVNGYLLSGSLSQSARHFEGKQQAYDGHEPESFLNKNSVMMSDGYLMFNFIGESAGPKIFASFMPRTMGEVMDLQTGYVASPLSESHAEQAVREVETLQRDQLVEEIGLLVEAVLRNPNKLKVRPPHVVARDDGLWC